MASSADPGTDGGRPPADPRSASFTLGVEIDSGIGGDIAEGWLFDIAATGGEASESTFLSPGWDDEETLPITVLVTDEHATLVLTEHLREGYLVQEAFCVDADAPPAEADPDTDEWPEPPHVGSLAGTALTFDLVPGAHYYCRFINRPRELPAATIVIQKWMDPDGNFNTNEGEGTGGSGWTFDIAVTGGTPSSEAVVTRQNGTATFAVAVDLGAARVRITERPSTMAPFLHADCWDALGEDDIRGGYMTDGTSIEFDAEPGGGYFCQVFNQGAAVVDELSPAPRATPPATDSPSRTPAPQLPWWPPLILVAASFLLVTARQRTRRGPDSSL